MRKIPKEILKESLTNSLDKSSNWSLPADFFIEWLVKKPEESNKSFDLLDSFLEREAPDWIVEELPEEIRGSQVWEWGSYNFVDFADEWVDPTEIKDYFVFCLIKIREMWNLSYEKLAREIGISTRNLIRWLKGEVKPSDMAMKFIEMYLKRIP